LVTRAGAQKYFAHWKSRIDVPIDNAIGEIPGVRLLRVKPEIATFEILRAWDSDIINTNNPLAKLLDYIPYGENMTLGFFMFYPGNGRPRKIDEWFLFLSFVLLVSFLLIKKLQ
jgi:hypothetical protein